MADYTSLKVPELKKLLQERGLAHAGNKADLIARLQENDKANVPEATNKGDEIDYEDDDIPVNVTEQKQESAAGTSTAEPVKALAATTDSTLTADKALSADVAAPKQTTTATSGEDVKPAEAAQGAGTAGAVTTAAEEAQTAPAQDVAAPMAFSQGLATSNAKTEAEKRAARAARFGISKPDKDSEEGKMAARAERFGVPDEELSALDSALPDQPVNRKRGRDRGDDGGEARGGPKKGSQTQTNGGGRQQGGGNQGRRNQQRGGGRRQGGGGGGGGGGRAPMRDQPKRGGAGEDAARLEARKKRFST